MGIKKQPKSGIINPFPGPKKCYYRHQGFCCLPGSFCFFTEHAVAARFLTAILILSAAVLCADSVARGVYPPSVPLFFPFSLLPCPLSPIWGQTTRKILPSAHKEVALATSSASTDSVTVFYQTSFFFFFTVGASLLCVISTGTLSLCPD